jgi:parallel beta-helix repeat protein
MDYYSSYNNITNNDFYHNTRYGISITHYSTGNIIHHNNFYQNNGASRGVSGNCQARDEVGGNYWYDNTAKEGNYWSNWDGNNNGTANAYPIDGGAGAYDMYPLGNPTPELSPVTLILVALGLLGVATVRRRK